MSELDALFTEHIIIFITDDRFTAYTDYLKIEQVKNKPITLRQVLNEV
jgi:hypothetical protein